jgi:hypothetical protein
MYFIRKSLLVGDKDLVINTYDISHLNPLLAKNIQEFYIIILLKMDSTFKGGFIKVKLTLDELLHYKYLREIEYKKKENVSIIAYINLIICARTKKKSKRILNPINKFNSLIKKRYIIMQGPETLRLINILGRPGLIGNNTVIYN